MAAERPKWSDHESVNLTSDIHKPAVPSAERQGGSSCSPITHLLPGDVGFECRSDIVVSNDIAVFDLAGLSARVIPVQLGTLQETEREEDIGWIVGGRYAEDCHDACYPLCVEIVEYVRSSRVTRTRLVSSLEFQRSNKVEDDLDQIDSVVQPP